MTWNSWWKNARVAGLYQTGTSGPWELDEFDVEEKDALISLFAYRDRAPEPGRYARLKRNGRVIMSDTPAEIRDLHELYVHAQNAERVLINGLGLGCALRLALASPTVEHVDVVEIDANVINLVGVYYATDSRVEIRQADAFEIEWPRGTRWEAAWHDVWDDLCTDNLSSEEFAVPGTYARLNRKYGRRVKWQGAWGQELLQDMRRRGQ